MLEIKPFYTFFRSPICAARSLPFFPPLFIHFILPDLRYPLPFADSCCSEIISPRTSFIPFERSISLSLSNQATTTSLLILTSVMKTRLITIRNYFSFSNIVRCNGGFCKVFVACRR